MRVIAFPVVLIGILLIAVGILGFVGGLLPGPHRLENLLGGTAFIAIGFGLLWLGRAAWRRGQRVVQFERARKVGFLRRVSREEKAPGVTVTLSGPTCGRCKKPLTLEDEPGDPFGRRLKQTTGSCYLATVCKQCGWIECYKCRGKVGAPCSKCNGSVSPAYKRLLG